MHVEVNAPGVVPGRHIVHVDIEPDFGPGAKSPIRHYAQTITCEAGRGDGYIPLALDDPAGVYRIVARDILTGASAKARVKVAP
jgi:hypothetical protein